MDSSESPRPSARRPILLRIVLLGIVIALLNVLVGRLFPPDRVYSVEGPPPAYRAQSPDVVLFATSWCGYCARARAYFNERGIPYLELDIETNDDADAEHEALGGRGVPVILIKDKILHGWSEAELTRTLQTAGLLK